MGKSTAPHVTDHELTGFLADHPIDSVLADKFSRRSFAERVASFVAKRCEENGIVMSIEGNWGSGKTSTLAMIQKMLRPYIQKKAIREGVHHSWINEMLNIARYGWFNWKTIKKTEKGIILVEFNPWLVGAADHMIQALFSQIAADIHLSSFSDEAANASKRFMAYAALLEPLKWVPGAEPLATITTQALQATGKASGALSELQKLSISNKRESLKQALRHLKKQIVIIIDDIDRLPPTEVFQAIRAIQAVSDLPCCSFVIALDAEYVEMSLRESAKFDVPSLYLDKIIQLRLLLPRLSRIDIEKFFEDKLASKLTIPQQNRLLNDEGRFLLISQLLYPLLRTPRDALRIINRFLYVEQGCGEDVCLADLLGLQLLAIVFPSVYGHILANPGAYTGVDMDDLYKRVTPQELVKQYAEQRNKLVSNFDIKTQRDIVRLIEELFPMTRKIAYDKRDQGGYSLQKRVASSERLRIALSYDIPGDEIGQGRIDSFLTCPDTRNTIFSEAFSRSLMSRLLERVLQDSSQANIPDPNELAIYLGRIIEEKDLGRDSEGFNSFFKLTPLRTIVLAARAILASSSQDYQQSLAAFVSNPRVLSLSSHFVLKEIIDRQKKSNNDQFDAASSLVSSEESMVLSQWVYVATDAFRSKAFLDASDKRTITRTLEWIKETREILPELLKPYLETTDSFEQIIDVFMGNYQVAMEEGSLEYSVACSEEFLSRLGDPSKIRNLADTLLSERGNSANPRTRAILQAILHPGRFSLIDASRLNEDGT